MKSWIVYHSRDLSFSSFVVLSKQFSVSSVQGINTTDGSGETTRLDDVPVQGTNFGPICTD